MSSPIASPAEVEAAMVQMMVNNTAVMREAEVKLKGYLKHPGIVGVLLQLVAGSANPVVRRVWRPVLAPLMSCAPNACALACRFVNWLRCTCGDASTRCGFACRRSNMLRSRGCVTVPAFSRAGDGL